MPVRSISKAAEAGRYQKGVYCEKKKLAKLLFGLKVLAICGAAVFMIKGIRKLYADAGSDASKEEEIGEVQVTEESATTEPETVVMPEIEENAIAEKAISGRGH